MDQHIHATKLPAAETSRQQPTHPGQAVCITVRIDNTARDSVPDIGSAAATPV